MSEEASWVRIELEDLAPPTLDALILEFVSREGTDYGHAEHSFEQKTAAVLAQLQRGEAFIVFDKESESTTIVPKEALS